MAFPFVKESKIERFVKQTQASDTFDLTKYWQLRDMVGGVYTYNPATIEPHSILHIKKLTSDTNHLLTNESQEFISKEYLVSGSVKDAELAKMLPGKVLFQDQGSVITYDELQRKLYIRSLYPFEEMKRHNGAVDYQVLEEDLSNYFWLITTEITVSPTFSV